MNITSLTKHQIAQAIIMQLEEQEEGIKIETDLFKNYVSPQKITQQSIQQEYHPDILTILENGETNVYEIELDGNINAEKWRVFSLFTKLKRGVLYIVVPESNLSEVEKIIVEKEFQNIKLIYIPN